MLQVQIHTKWKVFPQKENKGPNNEMILQKAGQEKIHVRLPGASTFCSLASKRFGDLVHVQYHSDIC